MEIKFKDGIKCGQLVTGDICIPIRNPDVHYQSRVCWILSTKEVTGKYKDKLVDLEFLWDGPGQIIRIMRVNADQPFLGGLIYIGRLPK